MPVKRRVPKPRQFTVTPETLAIWRICEELLADGSGQADGENREEYLELDAKFTLALGLGPWDHSPFFVRCPDPPHWVRRPESWREAWQMRRAFEVAARQAEAAERAGANSGRPPEPPARARGPTTAAARPRADSHPRRRCLR